MSGLPARSRAASAAIVLALATLVVAARDAGYLGGLKTAPAIVVAHPPVSEFADTLRPRETVGQLFARRGVGGVDWGAVAAAVRNFDPSRVRSGTVFSFRQRHDEEVPHVVAVRVSHDERLRLYRRDGRWEPDIERITWESEPFVLQGSVRTSISDAVTGAMGDDLLPFEARVSLVYALSEVYDWVIDFSRDLQVGDDFRILAERLISSEGEVRLGRILAARVDANRKAHYAYRFDDENGRSAFFDESGRSMKRELLRAPLEFRRISSNFSRSRFHPILRYSRPHLGIDFGAAYGSPVRSVGDGTVTQAGRNEGYGNLVEIRHNSTTTTRYAHLSAFGQGIRVGARVTQGQTVGYVGATGLATSPHLHYELRIGGQAVDPRRRNTSPGRPIEAARRGAFEAERDRLHMALEPGPAPRAVTD